MENYNQDILTEFETYVVQASKGKRFANFIIDTIVTYILIFIVVIILVLISPEMLQEIDESPGSSLFYNLFGLLCFVFYYSFFEAVFKGKTIGKMVTGTRAVNEDGSTISGKTAFLRGLSRIVPFEAFSALGDPSYPWHDSWTNSYVVDEKMSGMHLR